MGGGSIGHGIGTSGSGDSGYKGGTSYRSVGDNLSDVQKDYAYHDGRFGEKAKRACNRHIYGEDPVATAHDFYDRLTEGGVEKPLPNGEGVMATMRDGTVVSLRDTSRDGTPSLQIDIDESTGSGGLKNQKIHFEKRKGEDGK